MSLDQHQQENPQAAPTRQGQPRPTALPLVLKIGGLVLLVVAFAGPWIYGPIGKSGDWGWQPVWGMLLTFWGLNSVIIFSAISCYCYIELYYRLGRPPLAALLKWIGGFVGFVIGLPLAVWTIVDQSGRGKIQQNPDGSIGWGVGVALAGLALLVTGLRLQINEIRRETLNVERP